MGSLFDTLMADCASPMLEQHLGEAVSIARGQNTTVGVTASWTTQTEEVVTADGKHTALFDRFWFVRQSAYQISASAVEPRTGDRLTDAGGNVWEVLPRQSIPPVVSYAGGDVWKIATKRVS